MSRVSAEQRATEVMSLVTWMFYWSRNDSVHICEDIFNAYSIQIQACPFVHRTQDLGCQRIRFWLNCREGYKWVLCSSIFKITLKLATTFVYLLICPQRSCIICLLVSFTFRLLFWLTVKDVDSTHHFNLMLAILCLTSLIPYIHRRARTSSSHKRIISHTLKNSSSWTLLPCEFWSCET